MPKDRVVVGIDVGTSKICTVIATISAETETVNVIGVSTVTSKGLRKGQVVNIEETTSVITQSLEAAERMAGYTVSSAFVSVGGTHIASQNSHGMVAVAQPDAEITEDDVRRVTEAARAVSLPSSREIIHVIPRGFIVDGQEGIVDPVGMTGVRLEVNTHIISGATTSMRNLAKCVQEVGVDIDGLVFGGLAAGEAVLSETEQELGVVLVDIGGGTTDVCMYVDGALSHSFVLPIGSKNITNDLAVGLRVSLEAAEKIKIAAGQIPKFAIEPEDGNEIVEKPTTLKGIRDEKKKTDEIDLMQLGICDDVKSVSRKTIVEGIIKPRLTELFTLVGLEIKKSGFAGLTPAGLVICGGGAETVGVLETAKHVLAMPVRIGTPSGANGLIDEVSSATYATSLGLVLHGVHTQSVKKSRMMPSVGKLQFKGVVGRTVDILKSLLP